VLVGEDTREAGGERRKALSAGAADGRLPLIHRRHGCSVVHRIHRRPGSCWAPTDAGFKIDDCKHRTESRNRTVCLARDPFLPTDTFSNICNLFLGTVVLFAF
jgi:hypothetical protein